MSLTLVIWLFLFAALTIASARRPSFGVGVYMLSFFLCPPFWWWGDMIGAYRWNFYSGIILLGAVLLGGGKRISTLGIQGQRVFKMAMWIGLNATFVNFLLAADPESSSESYQLLLKFLLLQFLIYASIKSRFDLQVVMIAILSGAAYIGFEVTVNDRGDIQNNRLEGVGAPGASTANHFASLMVSVLPLVAPFFLVGKLWQKVFALVTAPLILNVVLLCNSRGAFLAGIVSAVVFLCVAPQSVRSKAWKLIAVGAFGTFLLLGDSRILDRFSTTFASAEERDTSAQSRIDFAKAGIEMIIDYPLGSGGGSFKKVRGAKYLKASGASDKAKAIHNGYLTEMCDWGIQGGFLRLAMYGFAIFATLRTLKQLPGTQENTFEQLCGCSFLAGMSALLVTSLFGDHLDSEWGLWLIALMMAFLSLARERIGPSAEANPLAMNVTGKAVMR